MAIFNHWLAGETSNKIAIKLHLKRQSIDEIIINAVNNKRGNNCITEQPPIYNVWNYAGCDPRFGQKHPGQIPGLIIVELHINLLTKRIILDSHSSPKFINKSKNGEIAKIGLYQKGNN